ncbi:uncharacterized protein LOC114298046 [Camellia sinensis]|uniref:uncharacterized protein LOC114298046 n=1 Tax=Camellia sinensis TaxID=4442 RepID=UPI00103638CC|nr:uncharacterized protein LOC114298046 [Camellia sinensis]
MDVQMHEKLYFLSSLSSSSLNMFSPHICTSLLFIYVATFASAATHLPPDEVEALKQIGKTLGKKENFSGEADPCRWAEGTENNVTCVLLLHHLVGYTSLLNCETQLILKKEFNLI